MPRLREFTVVAMLMVVTGVSLAQDWPARPVTMVVTFAAGSGDDLLARIVSPRLSQLLVNRSSLKTSAAPAE